MNHTCQRSQGFTLVEVVIATAVLAVTITGVLAVVVETNRLSQLNEERKIAEKKASAILELVESESTTLTNLTTFLDSKSQFSVDGLSPVEGKNNTGQITYTTEPDPNNKKNYVGVKVQVVIRWKGVMGDSSYSLSKIVSVQNKK